MHTSDNGIYVISWLLMSYLKEVVGGMQRNLHTSDNQLTIYQVTLLLTLLAAVEASRAHHVAHVGSHYGLHHLAGAFELLE